MLKAVVQVFAAVTLVACGPMYPPAQSPPPPPPQGEPEPAPSSDPLPQVPESRPAPAPPQSNLPTEANAFVAAHNKVRAAHCAGALGWSQKLADAAQRWANSLRDQGCKFGHSPNNAYGENLAAGTIGALDPGSVVAMWYDELKQYRFPSGGFSMETGHFTQVVWRGTTQVGCGHVQCNGNDIYVCEYDPAGNYEGQYEQNVLPAGCK